jgi:hypothetical protein
MRYASEGLECKEGAAGVSFATVSTNNWLASDIEHPAAQFLQANAMKSGSLMIGKGIALQNDGTSN